MGLSVDQLREALTALARLDPAIARALERAGHPPPRISARGYETLLRTIIGQQISTASARATWTRMQTMLGDTASPAAVLSASDESLRAAGLSRQKAGYARSLAGLVATGDLDLMNLPPDDEAAIAALIRIKGIGRWSAEIYLLFSEGRADIWPAGDLAIQIAVGDILGLEGRPSETLVRTLSESWRPHRGAAAILAWHHYSMRGKIKADAMPL
ncbi:DNA-3-methyladenine glycosylase 2 family protein [Acidisoma cellulosilytica]|uniref:DNA-3-methyladenine glycosylase II n=1 Tax=Acidisoma cellulosilyticum TaxID=2802395 RepID=A0A963Z6P4_9PROT|nr:DNA-3-methyladenine glycosylase 2 family protein [Acidisoma cellulosilyticum]MCB8883879.1 DNA-3-methyladenine glycosylase 2 family protein [Acidisoma cellulosilyticum]